MPSSAQLPRLMYGVEDAGMILGINRRQVFTEIQLGRLRSAKVGKRRLIPAQALLDWCDLVCGSGQDGAP